MPYLIKAKQNGNIDGVSGCGIIFALSSLNGSLTDYEQLGRTGNGEGKYKLLFVVHEVIIAASRVRQSLSLNEGIKYNIFI